MGHGHVNANIEQEFKFCLSSLSVLPPCALFPCNSSHLTTPLLRRVLVLYEFKVTLALYYQN